MYTYNRLRGINVNDMPVLLVEISPKTPHDDHDSREVLIESFGSAG